MSTPNPNTGKEYSECLMGSMVTPGEYWLINKNPAHILQVQQLEQDLSTLLENNSDVPHPEEVHTSDCVAVECPPENGVWKRGRAVSKIGRAVFKVFLVDSGQVIQVTVKRIRVPLDPKFLKVEPLAFKFCLYGVVPCIVQPDGKKRVTLKWTDESRCFVSNLLFRKHFFHIKIVQMLRRTILGDIYLFKKQSRQFYSLNRLLCAKNLAVYAEPYYREKVMLLEYSLVDNRYLTPDSEVSIHMDTKLKRMEELRLVNLQHESDWHVRDGRASSSSGSQSDENEELEESALCDNSSQLAQDLLNNLSIRRNFRSESVSDFPEVGLSMPSNFQNQELDKELVDGSHDELPPLESVKRKPCTSLMEEQIPKPLMVTGFPKPSVGIESPRPSDEEVVDGSHDGLPPVESVKRKPCTSLMEEQIPKPLMVTGFPQPSVGIESPRPSDEEVVDGSHDELPPLESVKRKPCTSLMEEQIPMPLTVIDFPKPLMAIESPRPSDEEVVDGSHDELPPLESVKRKPCTSLMEEQIPMPLTVIDFPKPLMAIEIPKSSVGTEIQKSLVDIESPRPSDEELVDGSHDEMPPLESVNRKPHPTSMIENMAPRPLMEIEIPKSSVGTEIQKSSVDIESPRPSVDIESPRPSDEEVADGSHDEMPPLESVKRKPHPTSMIENMAPRPLMEIEIPVPLVEKSVPRPLMEIEVPVPVVEKSGPRPLMEIEIPMPVMEKQTPKPLTEKQTPKPLTVIQFPKPSVGIEIPKPLEGIEFRMPLVGIEIPKPLEGIEFRKPFQGIEIQRSLEGIEIPKPLQGIESPEPVMEKEIPESFMENETSELSTEKQISESFMENETSELSTEKQISESFMENETSEPSTEIQILKTLMEICIPESVEKDKVSEACNKNNHLHTKGLKEQTDGEKRIRKEFKIFFEEKDNLPDLEVDGHYEVFHFFYDNTLEPLNHFKHLNISRILFRNIERQVMFQQPSPIQRWAIPSIVNGDDLVIIGEPKSGKTLSYILGILEVVKLKMEVGQFCLGKGPLAVILSCSSRTCEFIYKIFTMLTNKKDRKFQVPLCRLNVRFVNNAVVDRHSTPFIVNRCDVLISTPQCLLRIVNNRNISEFNKLIAVVFDGADISPGETFLTEMKLLLNQSKIPKHVQKIFCGERWTQDFEALTRTFVRDHSAVIGSFSEATAYANLQPNVLFIDVSERDRILLDLTLQEHRGHKVVIVCNNTEEVFHVETLFKNKNKICSVACAGTQTEVLKNIKYNWGRSRELCVVVCTQDIIEELGICNADVLINYALPSDREVSFGIRFLLIANKMRDYIFQRRVCPLVDFLIADKTYFRSPELVDFLQRQEIQIPPSLKDDVKAEIEESEQAFPLCENVLKFGNCNEVWKCKKRHTFIKDIDFPAKPLCGIIKFLILKVHNVSHLSVRIIELSDQQNNYQKVIFPDLTLQITRQLRNIFRDKCNRIPLKSAEVNALCVLNRNDASGMRFHRAQIMEIKEFLQPVEVIVKLIDWGYVLRANVSKLLELPEELKTYPALSTDVYLCNLAPKCFDREWSSRDLSFAKNMFMMELEENQIWIARVKLSLESALLIDPVKLCRTSENEKGYVIEFSACQKLLYSGIANERPEHLRTLYELCEKANVDTSIYEYNLEASENSCQPECAHFDIDFLKIQFIYAESPTSLYVRISKFEDLLINLESECNAVGVRQQKTQNCNLNNPILRKKLSIGMCCLALNGTSWNRARIMSFEKDRAKVFFIDYGDTEYVEHVVPVPEKLLTKLPSQAIECYLVGVNPEMKVSDEVLEEIYDFSKNGSEELSVCVVEKVVMSQVTGGWKYGINLLNSEGKSLSKKLIDLGLVQPTGDYLDLAIDMEKMPIDDANEIDAESWDCDYDEDGNKDKVDISEIEGLSIVDNTSGSDVNKAFVTPEAADDLSYFLTLESTVFDDDNACCMLEEFLCNLAPEQVTRKEPKNETKIDKKEYEPVPENNEVVVQEEEGVDGVPQAASAEEIPAEEEPGEEVVQNDARLDEAAALEARLNYLSKRNRTVNRTLPYLKYIPDGSVAEKTNHLIPTDVLTPEVLWSQTHTEVEVKIMLTNVVTYKFDCTVEKYIFRCLLNKKPYVSYVRLFGAINPETTRVEIKTFFVQIVFQKLCPLVWPRLCRENKKYRWIKYNIEHFKEKKCTISEILCSQAMERIKSGNIIVPKVTDEIKFVPSSSSEGSDWTDSEGEEV